MCGGTRMKHSKLSKPSIQTKNIWVQSIQHSFLSVSLVSSHCVLFYMNLSHHHHIAFWTPSLPKYLSRTSAPLLCTKNLLPLFLIPQDLSRSRIGSRFPGFNVTYELHEFYHINIASSKNFEHISTQHIFWILDPVFIVHGRFRSKH